MMLIIPLILIVLTILGFAALIIYDERKKGGKKKEEEKEKDETKDKKIEVSEEPVKDETILQIKNIIKKKKQKGEEEEIDVTKLKNENLNALANLEKNVNQISDEQLLGKIIYIIRIFFSKLLNLKYFFTHEELEKELKKNTNVKTKISFISDRLSELQYNPEGIHLKKKEMLDLIHDLKEVISYIDLKKQSAQKKNKTEIHKIQSEIIKLIEYGEYMLTRDIKISSNVYHRIYSLYNLLNEGEKEEVYSRIIDFYENMKKFLS